LGIAALIKWFLRNFCINCMHDCSHFQKNPFGFPRKLSVFEKIKQFTVSRKWNGFPFSFLKFWKLIFLSKNQKPENLFDKLENHPVFDKTTRFLIFNPNFGFWILHRFRAVLSIFTIFTKPVKTDFLARFSFSVPAVTL
jgi:hypothetical protein